MKELNQPTKDPTEISTPVRQEKQLKYLGKLRPHPGQKVYQLDLKTYEITEAVYEELNADFTKAAAGVHEVVKKLIVKENCVYAVAINVKNADKKFIKMLIK